MESELSKYDQKSLTELGIKKPSSSIESSLVKACSLALDVKLNELKNGDLRMLISQEIGLEFLIPKALERLEDEPFLDGGFYQGDLLAAVVSVSVQFWENNTELNNQLVEIKLRIEEIIETINDEIMPNLGKFEYK